MDESALIFDRYVSGSESAADQLFHRYVDRLTRLARSRLSAALAQRVDAEDVVMSTYRSFFIRARDGNFAIERSGDLWALLVRITLNKLARTAAHHTAQKRNVRDEIGAIRDIALKEPSVVEAAALADELEAFMATVSKGSRRMLELRLQGFTIDEIADDTGVNERTVRRHLQQMRQGLTKMAGLSDIPAAPPAGPELRAKPAEEVDRSQPPSGDQDYTDFMLEKQIGIGGMGRVYRARKKSTGELVAVKYLRKTFLRQPAAVERFVREATTVRELAHPNIVPVRGFGRTNGGGLFIVMELIQGPDLADICQQPTPSSTEIVRWLLPVADALAHAHEAGVVHCDLKPANILVQDGVPMLTDFGLARRVGERVSASEFSGTVPFMAPEQIDASLGSIGPHTDVYGLGSVLFYLLTGRPPFQGKRISDVMANIVTSHPAPKPSQFGATSEFDSLIRDALTRMPARISSSTGFASRLRQIMNA